MRVLMVVVKERQEEGRIERRERERGRGGGGERERERLLTVVERVDRAWVAGLANANMLSSR